MSLLKLIGATLATCAFAFLGACSSMGQDSADSATARPASAVAAAPGNTGAPAARSSAVQFDGPGQPEQAARGLGSTADQTVRPLALYGQLPIAGPQRATNLDSPDNLTHVTFAFEGSDFDPAIDPTGQWLVYASTQHRQTADLYLKRVNGTTVTQLTSDSGNHVMPAFSPDGKRIVYASDRGGTYAIYMMDVQGGQPVQLTNDSNNNIHPSFSHDGKQLVYCSSGGQGGQWQMVVLDVDNPAAKHFIGQGLFPTFSPVDNHILFQRARERGSRWFSLWTIDLVNGEGVQPTEIAASANAALITPSWSPDGKHIAFCTVLDPGTEDHSRPTQADIWIIADDGTGRVNLTHSPFANLQPTWGRDNTIYFTSNRSKDNTENVWSIRPERALQVADRSDVNEGPSARANGSPAPMMSAGRPAAAPSAAATPSASASASASAMPASAAAAPTHAVAATPANDSGSVPNAAHTKADQSEQPAAHGQQPQPAGVDSSAMVPTE